MKQSAYRRLTHTHTVIRNGKFDIIYGKFAQFTLARDIVEKLPKLKHKLPNLPQTSNELSIMIKVTIFAIILNIFFT